MKPIELAAVAARALADGQGVVLTIPKGGLHRTFPLGELLNERMRKGKIERTYRFDPQAVLDWLLRNRLIEVERTSERTLTFKECAPA